MGFLGALTTQNKTDLRSGDYNAIQLLALVPNTTIVQFTPDTSNSDLIYASIPVGTVASGSMSNVKSFMTVIYSTTTDYANTEQYRTYVRKVDGTSTLYVGESGQSYASGTYITVLDTYDVFMKPPTVRDGTEYRDWEIAFRRLLPIESALPSAVVLTGGTTSYSPTASPTAIDNDATSTFTHAWESSNSSDSLDSGGTTNNPTFTLQANSFRWIRYTFTDSNGNANLRVIPVWTVPADYSNTNVITSAGFSGEFADINYDVELGWLGSVPAFEGVSGLLDNTYCCVFSVEQINGSEQSINGNINFVGYLSGQTTATRGDERYGRISSARFALDGFGSVLSQTPVPTFPVTRSASPSSWGDIENPTPGRVTVYTLTEHTTAALLFPLSLPSDDANFTATGDFFAQQETVAFDAVKVIADTVNAKLQFAPDGTAAITRRLVHLGTTPRDAATTVVDLTSDDMLEFELSISEKTVNHLIVAGGVYDTTNNDFSVFQAIVPPKADIRGTESAQVVNQLMEADQTDANAKTELGQRAANRYAALSPTYTCTVTLYDSWHFLIPDVGTWYTLTIGSDDNTLGLAFTSSDRWQLLEISNAANNADGTREVSATFRLETESTGANIEVAKLENDPDADLNLLPATLPPFSGGSLDLTDGDWYDSLDTAPPSDPTPVASNCEIGGFRVQNGASGYNTAPALNGESIQATIRGSGKIGNGNQVVACDPQAEAGSATGITVSAGDSIDFTASGSWAVNPSDPLVDADGYATTNPSTLLPSAKTAALIGKVGSGDYFLIGTSATVVADASGEIRLWINDVPGAFGDNVGSMSVTISAGDVYGDAFYSWSENGTPSAYGAGDGLLVEGFQPGAIPPYNSNHEYELYFTVNSGPVQYTYESPYPLAQADNWSFQIITCFLGVP